MNTIYLVWADRGSYSDRTEYAVCWYESEAEAKKQAESMQAKSTQWRARCANRWSVLSAVWSEAQADIGDPYWSVSDETNYSAYALERGA